MQMIFSRLSRLAACGRPACSLTQTLQFQAGFNKSAGRLFVVVRNASTSKDFQQPQSLDIDSTALQDASESLMQPAAELADPTFASVGLGGWLPPGAIQNFLEFLHTQVGVSWCAAIVVTTVAMRAAMLPVYIGSRKFSVDLLNHWPVISRLEQRIFAANSVGKYEEAERIKEERRKLMKTHNLSPFRICYPLMQALCLVTTMSAIQGLTKANLPSMTHGGILWFSNLCEVDPYGILSLLTAASLWITLETGAEGVSVDAANHRVRWLMRIVCLCSAPVIWQFPAALNLYWVSSNTITLGLVCVLKNESIKRALKLSSVNRNNDNNEHEQSSAAAKERVSLRDALATVRDRRAEMDRQVIREEFARRASNAQRTHKQMQRDVFADADAAYEDACRRGSSVQPQPNADQDHSATTKSKSQRGV